MSPPRRNRVDPFGELVADPSRGSLFGNRGVLHDEHGEVRRHHDGKRWIYCRLEYKGLRRALMQPGRFTGLFFLDEATALAAGHRPCTLCMRERAIAFRDAWTTANPGIAAEPVRAPAIDAELHRERLDGPSGKRTHEARIGDLPNGAMVVAGSAPAPHLVETGRLLPWSFGGYGPPLAIADRDAVVEVLTPASVVRSIAAGFVPNAAGERT
ncbi:MAG: hypothetical protein EDQ89_01755 [Acidobacteria bacterium]|nr:MAG: hypothetical protein EDQ89_01755 [Acidobacteriota bacterium]